MATISDLPTSLLMDIFVRVDLADWVKTLSRVCLLWKNVTCHLWEKIDSFAYEVEVKNSYFDQKDIHRFAAELSDGRKLCFEKRYTRSYDTGFMYFVNTCSKRLKSLCFGTNLTNFFNPNTIVLIGEKFIGLKVLKLHIQSTEILMPEILANVFRRLICLEEIDINFNQFNCSRFRILNQQNLFVDSAVVSCKNLRVVNITLSDIPNISSWRSLDGLPNLEIFSWSCLRPTATAYLKEMLAFLGRCSDKLNSISLNYRLHEDSALDGPLFKQLMIDLAKKSVVKLDLELSVVRDEPFIVPRLDGFGEMLFALVEFKFLKDLTLKDIDFAHYDQLPIIFQHISSRLTKLCFSDCILENSFFGILSFSGGMPALETLEMVECCERFDETHLVEFVSKCTKLQRIYVDLWLNKFYFDRFLILCHTVVHDCNRVAVEAENLRFPSLDVIMKIKFTDEYLKNFENLCSIKIDKNDDCTVFRLFKRCMR